MLTLGLVLVLLLVGLVLHTLPLYSLYLLHKSHVNITLWLPKYLSHQAQKQKGSPIERVLKRIQSSRAPFMTFATLFFNQCVVHIGHPSLAKRVLLEQTKQPIYNHFKGFSGQGTFSADGKEWKSKRATLSLNVFRSSVALIQKLAEKHGRALSASLTSNLRHISDPDTDADDSSLDQKERGIVDILPHLQRCTLSIIFEYLTQTPLELDKAEVVDLVDQYLDAIRDIRMILLGRTKTLSIFDVIYRCTSLYRQERYAMQVITKFAEYAIRRAHTHMHTVLSPIELLEASETHNRRQDLIDEVITLMFAGQDTSAATLAWSVYFLSQYPSSQTTARLEILSRQKERATTDAGKSTATNTYPYTEAVIKETMRLYPVAPFVMRRTTQTHTYTDPDTASTLTLPKGCYVCVWIYALHRNERFWQHANAFVPERWIASATTSPSNEQHNSSDRSTHMVSGTQHGKTCLSDNFEAYMPFAHGPRKCIGQVFGSVSVNTILRELLRVCTFESLEPCLNTHTKQMEMGFTVLPHDGVRVRVRLGEGLRIKVMS